MPTQDPDIATQELSDEAKDRLAAGRERQRSLLNAPLADADN